MPYAFALAIVVLFTACGDADLEAGPTSAPTAEPAEVTPTSAVLESRQAGEANGPVEAAPAEATAAPAAGRTTEDCRERAAEVASWGYGRAMPEHTFAFATPRDDSACLIPLRYNASVGEDGEIPYLYSFQVDEDGELRDLLLETAPLSSAVVVAVGSEDVNGDGVPDLFVVHEGDHASIAFLSDAEGWSQALIDNGESGVFATTIDEVVEFWKNPSFPP